MKAQDKTQNGYNISHRHGDSTRNRRWFLSSTLMAAIIGGTVPIACHSAPSNTGTPTAGGLKTKTETPSITNRDTNAQIGEQRVNKQIDTKNIFDTDTLISAYYKIESSTFGSQVCTGESQLKVYSTVKKTGSLFSVPQGTLNCGPLGTVNLKPLFEPFALNPADGTTETSGNLVRLKSVGEVSYLPPRPILPAFLSSSNDELARLRSASNHEAFDTTKNVRSSGVIQAEMVSTGQELRSTELRYTFRDVMTFRMICSGFDEIDKVANSCYDLAEWHISLNPLAIIKIKLITTASALIASIKNKPEISNGQLDGLIKSLPTTNGGGILDGLIGTEVDKNLQATKVEINLVLADQKNLGSSEAKNDAKEADDGVIIGK